MNKEVEEDVKKLKKKHAKSRKGAWTPPTTTAVNRGAR